MSKVDEASSGAAVRLEHLSRWLNAYYPGLADGNEDPVERAKQLLQAMRSRLDSVALLAGSPVPLGTRVAFGGGKIQDDELLALVKPTQKTTVRFPERALLNRAIDTMPMEGFSQTKARTVKCLVRNDIRWVGQLVSLTRDDLLRLKGFGRDMLKRIIDALALMRLPLGLNVDWWKAPIHVQDVCAQDAGLLPVLNLNIGDFLDHWSSRGEKSRILRGLSEATRDNDSMSFYNGQVGALIQLTEQQLAGMPGIGRKAMRHIKEGLASHGLKLGTNLTGWPTDPEQGSPGES